MKTRSLFAADRRSDFLAYSNHADLSGGPSVSDFLNPGTAEQDRLLSGTSTSGGAQAEGSGHRISAPDGTALNGNSYVAAKEGELTAGNGLYGSGNVCLFSGFATG